MLQKYGVENNKALGKALCQKPSALLLWALFFGLFGSLGAAVGDTVEETDGSGLLIRSEPSGARVYIDGIERGLTPLSISALSSGDYNIRLTKEGYESRRIKVRIRSSSRMMVSINLEESRGQVFLRVDRSPGSPPADKLPLNPAVSVDGSPVLGRTLSLPVGFRTIRVRSFGWEEAVRTVYVSSHEARLVEFALKPAVFRIASATARRPRFNPANPGSLGTTELAFEVSAAGQGRIIVEDAAGNTVFSQVLPSFTTWAQSVTWNGRTGDGRPLPDGTYRVSIEAESIPWDESEPAFQRAEVFAAIDASLRISPLALASGSSGLLLSPAPSVLPRGSFQINGTFLFGRPPLTGDPWRALPFSGAFRFSPLNRLEFAGTLNVTADLDAEEQAQAFQADWKASFLAAGGSVKWQVLSASEESPLALAAALSYGWAEEGAQSPFGMDAGVKLLLPLSWRLNPAFSLILAPALLWTGNEGYPSEAIPRLLLPGGVLFQHGFVSAGLSLRSEYRFGPAAKGAAHSLDSAVIGNADGVLGGTGGSDEPGGLPAWMGPLAVAAELRLFPPPSSFIFSLLGGLWFAGNTMGGYGGVGVGFIY
jgi:hypothetical protein